MRRFWRGTLLSAAVLLLLSMTPALAGCGDGGGARVPAEVRAMMRKVPADAGECTFLDLRGLRRDGDLRGIYESTAARLEGPEGAGIPADNVDRMVQAGSLTILEGHFDLRSLEAGLAGAGYAEGDHEGTPLWRGPSSSVALVGPGCLVTGWDAREVTDCLDIMGGEGGGSLCDAADVGELLDRLPRGFMVMVFAGGGEFADVRQGVTVTGYSLARDGPHTALMTVILVFGDAARAAEAEGHVEEMLTGGGGEGGARGVLVARDGRYVKATGRMPIEGAPG